MDIPLGRNLDTVTPSEWNAATIQERQSFINFWRKKGYVSFVCLTCGFPTVLGQATCEACRYTIVIAEK